MNEIIYYHDEKRRDEIEEMENILINGFDWGRSLNGAVYWADVYDALTKERKRLVEKKKCTCECHDE